eukprot:COSAG06_NODE_51013_length_315_cov_0.337963_2_plen_21_part_01
MSEGIEHRCAAAATAAAARDP